MNIELRQLGPSLTFVRIGQADFYFSYETCVAVRTDSRFVISENVWSRTTGKHLTEICSDKSRRVKHAEFEKVLAEVTAKL